MVALMVAASACDGAEAVDPDWQAARDVFETCAACHGKSGEGGIAPPLTAVRESFPDCATHMRWISLGSEGWKKEVGEVYGAFGKPVVGRMPAFSNLTELQLQQIAVYERVRFGGGELTSERAACGLG